MYMYMYMYIYIYIYTHTAALRKVVTFSSTRCDECLRRLSCMWFVGGSWRVESPFPLRHLSCLSAAQVHERGSE